MPSIGPLMIALLLGALVTNLGLTRAAFLPEFMFSVKRLLRLGIVLLGLQLEHQSGVQGRQDRGSGCARR